MIEGLLEILIELGVQALGQFLGEVAIHRWLATVIALAIGVASAFVVGPKGLAMSIPGFGVGLGIEWALNRTPPNRNSTDEN